MYSDKISLNNQVFELDTLSGQRRLRTETITQPNIDNLHKTETISTDSMLFCSLLLHQCGCLEFAVFEMQAGNYEKAVQILKEEWIYDLPTFAEDLPIPDELHGIDVLDGVTQSQSVLLTVCYEKLDLHNLAIEEAASGWPEDEKEMARINAEGWLPILLDQLPVCFGYIKEQVTTIKKATGAFLPLSEEREEEPLHATGVRGEPLKPLSLLQ